MKTIFRLFVVLGLFLSVPGLCTFGQVSINSDGASPDASAMLDVKSADKGILIPRITASQRIVISSPASGLLVFQTDGTTGFYYYNGTAWTFLKSGDGQSSNVIDMDGNTYPTVRIGNQEWMAENLRVTHYRNGNPIPNITNSTDWYSLITGARCFYSNDSATNNPKYGGLYNWYAVNDSRNLCPVGWHMPSDDEWTTLTTYLGGVSVAGGPMKRAIQWNSPNTGATNTSGFSGIAGGIRGNWGNCVSIGDVGIWWTVTETGTTTALYRMLNNMETIVDFYDSPKHYGYSVRCVRD